MEKIKNAGQESSARSSPTMNEVVVNKGNNAVDAGEVCPYCGSKDTVMLDDFLDEKNNVVSEAWLCSAPQCYTGGFSREVKLDKNGKIVSSRAFAGKPV